MSGKFNNNNHMENEDDDDNDNIADTKNGYFMNIKLEAPNNIMPNHKRKSEQDEEKIYIEEEEEGEGEGKRSHPQGDGDSMCPEEQEQQVLPKLELDNDLIMEQINPEALVNKGHQQTCIKMNELAKSLTDINASTNINKGSANKKEFSGIGDTLPNFLLKILNRHKKMTFEQIVEEVNMVYDNLRQDNGTPYPPDMIQSLREVFTGSTIFRNIGDNHWTADTNLINNYDTKMMNKSGGGNAGGKKDYGNKKNKKNKKNQDEGNSKNTNTTTTATMTKPTKKKPKKKKVDDTSEDEEEGIEINMIECEPRQFLKHNNNKFGMVNKVIMLPTSSGSLATIHQSNNTSKSNKKKKDKETDHFQLVINILNRALYNAKQNPIAGGMIENPFEGFMGNETFEDMTKRFGYEKLIGIFQCFEHFLPCLEEVFKMKYGGINSNGGGGNGGGGNGSGSGVAAVINGNSSNGYGGGNNGYRSGNNGNKEDDPIVKEMKMMLNGMNIIKEKIDGLTQKFEVNDDHGDGDNGNKLELNKNLQMCK